MPHALTPAERATNASAATYGELVENTRQRLALAITRTPRLMDADAIAVELQGYEKFLRVAGHHLALLSGLSGATDTSVEQLGRKLVRLPLREDPAGLWVDAAAALGAAHDLVSTHVVAMAPRTSEATDVVAGPASLAASTETVRLILNAELGSQAALDRLKWRRRHMDWSPALTQGVARVRAINSKIDTTSKAALWELERQGPNSMPTLNDLHAAATPYVLARGTAMERQLSALRLLSQVVLRQSEGHEPASPASLRDLALLAARVTDPSRALPEPRTALDRVRLAHAQDRLDLAHSAWVAAGRELTSSIQGLSKAPSSFRAAIAGVLGGEQEPPLALRIAVGAALPRLAADATATVSTMTAEGSLLTRQREFAQTRVTWKRITHEEGAHLASRFRDAGAASAGVSRVLRDLAPAPTGSRGARPVEPVVTRGLDVPSQGVSR